MWQNELANRFEKAEQTSDPGAVRIRVGTRPHLNTVAIVVWDDRYQNKSENFHAVECDNMEEAAEMTSQILTDAGFATEFPNCRVDFKHAETNKDLPSWSGTCDIMESGQPGASVESVLAEALRQNNVEMRRMFGMVTECLQSREERIDQDRDEILELSRSEVLARAEAEMSQILAEEAAQVQIEDDPLKARAGEILGVIAEKFLGSSATPRDTVLAILRQDPGLTAQLAGDEEVVGLFNDAILKEAAEAAAEDMHAREEYAAEQTQESYQAQAEEQVELAMEEERPPGGMGPNPMAPEEDDGIPF